MLFSLPFFLFFFGLISILTALHQDDDKAQRSYNEAMLKAYKYQKPKDKRSDAEKAKFREEARKWSSIITKHEFETNAFEQKRLDFMWESINAVPEGPLRDACLVEDLTPPPEVMRTLVLADIGPIPESEVERLDPFVIDHTLLQRMGDDAPRPQEPEKKGPQRGGKRKGKK